MTVFIWLGIMIILLLAEAATVGLTTIWFAAGALAAMVLCALGVGAFGQWTVFFVEKFDIMIDNRNKSKRTLELLKGYQYGRK